MTKPYWTNERLLSMLKQLPNHVYCVALQIYDNGRFSSTLSILSLAGTCWPLSNWPEPYIAQCTGLLPGCYRIQDECVWLKVVHRTHSLHHRSVPHSTWISGRSRRVGWGILDNYESDHSCTIWGFHGSDYEEYRLLGYKDQVRTSQEARYFSAIEPSLLMLCKFWGFHGGDYEKCRLRGKY
jgi:hypothetical protein